MADLTIGTVDVPERVERARYFQDLSYLELSALYAGPLKPSALARWTDVAPAGALGLVAPWVLTHRKPPTAAKLWDHDASVGDFRDSPLSRTALGSLHDAVTTVGARCAVFRSPPAFAPSVANRDALRRFFSEIATAEAVGADRVWVPDGLWELHACTKLATELGVTCAIDPLVREPGAPPDLYWNLEVESLYLRVEGAGRAGSLRPEQQEELVALIEHYEPIRLTVAFASPARWQDARNLKKLLD
jgi:uncharacterized protein YecE (DUF72 family)